MQMHAPLKQTAGHSCIFCIILNLTITSLHSQLLQVRCMLWKINLVLKETGARRIGQALHTDAKEMCEPRGTIWLVKVEDTI